MPRYRVLERSYFDGRLVEPGEEVNWDGTAGSNIELISDDETPKGKAKAKADADAAAKVALAEEAKQMKAVAIGADGKPTGKLIDGSEDLETIQAAISAVQLNKVT